LVRTLAHSQLGNFKSWRFGFGWSLIWGHYYRDQTTGYVKYNYVLLETDRRFWVWICS